MTDLQKFNGLLRASAADPFRRLANFAIFQLLTGPRLIVAALRAPRPLSYVGLVARLYGMSFRSGLLRGGLGLATLVLLLPLYLVGALMFTFGPVSGLSALGVAIAAAACYSLDIDGALLVAALALGGLAGFPLIAVTTLVADKLINKEDD